MAFSSLGCTSLFGRWRSADAPWDTAERSGYSWLFSALEWGNYCCRRLTGRRQERGPPFVRVLLGKAILLSSDYLCTYLQNLPSSCLLFFRVHRIAGKDYRHKCIKSFPLASSSISSTAFISREPADMAGGEPQLRCINSSPQLCSITDP